MLLGASERPGAEYPCRVCAHSLRPACCRCALLMARQLRTTFWYYSAIRWPRGWQTIGNSGEAPSVPGSFNDCTSLIMLATHEGHNCLTPWGSTATDLTASSRQTRAALSSTGGLANSSSCQTMCLGYGHSRLRPTCTSSRR